MLGIPHDGDTSVITNLTALGTATPGTAVTTGGTSSTKGTAVELISAANNTQDTYGIYIITAAYAAPATASDGALDILVGAATETVLIPNLLFGYCSDQTGNGVKKWFFPLHIPAGTRIAAQAAGLRTTTAVQVGVKLYGGLTPNWKCGSKVVTYGMGTVPTGTSLTLGASGAQGSYTQVTASTSEDHICLVPSFQLSNQTTMAGRDWHIGIGLGAATEELYHEWDYDGSANETLNGPFDTTPVYRDIPSGTRLTVRGSNNGVTQTCNVVIHGVS